MLVKIEIWKNAQNSKKILKSGLVLIYMSCVSVGHDCLGKCKNNAIQCVIYRVAQKKVNHKYGVIRYIAKLGKIYIHVKPKYANCGKNHQATIFKSPTLFKP